MQQPYSKSVKKRLSQLAVMAHEWELAAELGKLHEDFESWRTRTIDPFELNHRIHRFHQEIARDIWKIYVYRGDNDMLVASGRWPRVS